MSGARQGLRGLFGEERGRWWRFLLTILLLALSLPVFAALALALRLWASPMDVTDTARGLLARHGLPELSVGRVRLAWNGWAEGPRAPLALLLDDVRLGPSRIGHAEAALDLLPLMHGQVSILALRVEDGAVVLHRRRDGALEPQQRPGAPGKAGAGHPQAGIDLDELREVGVSRSRLVLDDDASGLSCRADIADLLLHPLRRPAATGAAGNFAASLSCGGPGIGLHGAGREGPGGDIEWRLTSGTIDPAAVARGIPQLSALGGLELPVTLTMRAALSGGSGRIMLPRAIELAASLGAGSIRAAGSNGPGLPVQAGRIHLFLHLPEAEGGAATAVLSDSSLVLAGPGAPTLDLGGSGSARGQAVQADFECRIARFDFAGLQRYWPEPLAPGARRWVAENITAGSGRNFVASAELKSATGVSGLHLTRLGGGLDGSDLTLFWLHPIPPLQHMDAHLTLEGPDSLRIDSRHATETVPQHGSIAIGPASMRITGLSHKEQFGRIDLRERGALNDLLVLLAHPRLRLLSRHPLPFTDPSGTVDAHLLVSLPLIAAVRIEDVAIRVDAALAAVHLGNVAVGRDLDRGNLTLEADNAGLRLKGRGAFAQLPVAFTYGMDFRPGGPAQITEHAHVSAPIDDAAMRREGLDSGHRFSGTALATLDYDHRRGGASRIALDLDLDGAELELPGWHKQAGDAGQASGTLGLQDGRLVSIESLHAEGPGLSLDGHADVEQGHPHALVLEHFTFGRSSGAGRIEMAPAGSNRPVRVALHGPVLDLAPFLSESFLSSPPGGSGAKPAASPAAPDPGRASPQDIAWSADLDFRKVLTGPSRFFTLVTLRAEASGMRVETARLSVGGPTPLHATVSRDGDERQAGERQAGVRRLALDAPDFGALLMALGVKERVEGGALDLRSRMEDASSGVRLAGLATVGPFVIHDAPLAARVARDLSIYGFVGGPTHRQLAVTGVEIPFTMQDGMLRLSGAHAHSAALGATLRGSVDLRQDMLDLRGTVVPSYLFNALPGKLPGLGRVFSPEKGGGLLAVTLRITGPLTNPAVRFNPLSLLAPGILRRLLFN